MLQQGFDHLTQRSLYRQYRDRLDGREILSYYGAENMSEYVSRDGTTEIVHSCLLDRVEPHHKNGDANPSASLNVDKKVYKCWSYIGCDLFTLVMKLENKGSLVDVIPTLTEFATGEETGTSLKKKLQLAFAGGYDASHVELPVYSDSILKNWEYHVPYWKERGVTPEAVVKLHLGYDPLGKRVTFPHFVDGVLVGYQQRVTPESPDQFPKYKSSSGFPKQISLYNMDLARSYQNVCVVESPMSVAKAISFGYENVVATFGASVSDEHIEMLKSFSRVYVWMDDDNAGHLGEKKLVEGLWRFVDVRVVTSDPGLDLADCQTKQDFERKITEAQPSYLKLALWRKYD